MKSFGAIFVGVLASTSDDGCGTCTSRPKVWGLGPGRTGTDSLRVALTDLGTSFGAYMLSKMIGPASKKKLETKIE